MCFGGRLGYDLVEALAFGILPVGFTGLVGTGFVNGILLFYIVSRRSVYMSVVVEPAYIIDYGNSHDCHENSYKKPFPRSARLFVED